MSRRLRLWRPRNSRCPWLHLRPCAMHSASPAPVADRRRRVIWLIGRMFKGGLMWRLCAGLMLGLTSMVANAELVAETLRWRQGGMAFEGYLAYDDANLERRPAVLVVPEWWGINDYSRMRAEQLAEMGYLALVVDMYGNGRSTTDAEQAAAWAKEVRGERMRERMAAAFKALQGHKLADRENVAAIGFCFGGTAVLEFAYGGAPVNGVVSFHG